MRKRLNTEDTETTEVTERENSQLIVPTESGIFDLQLTVHGRKKGAARRRMLAKKQKGRNCGLAAVSPGIRIAKLERFASAHFDELHVAGRRNAKHGSGSV
jgi:hypothetical protein